MERHGAPETTRSNCGSLTLDSSKTKLPEGLVGPVSEVPVQIEATFTPKHFLTAGHRLLYYIVVFMILISPIWIFSLCKTLRFGV